MNEYLKNIFHEPDESPFLILGDSFLRALASGEGMSGSSLILTNKRVYQHGIYYEFGGTRNRALIKKKGTSVVNVEDVTGISVEKYNNPMALPTVLIGIILSFVSVAATFFEFIPLGIIVIAFGIWMLFTSYELMIINYMGGSIAVKTHWFAYSDLIDFQKAVFSQKKKNKEGHLDRFVECTFCAEKIRENAKICRFCGNSQK